MTLAKRRRLHATDPMAVVTRFIDAANHHDSDTLLACTHHAFESIQPVHPGRDFRGAGQLINNWRAIFEAEPGFRLTVLRAAVEGNTVWVEVNGAGAEQEAAGIFIVQIEDGRIRWIRVYSDLIEPLPEAPPEEADTPAAAPAGSGGKGEPAGSGGKAEPGLHLVEPDEEPRAVSPPAGEPAAAPAAVAGSGAAAREDQPDEEWALRLVEGLAVGGPDEDHAPPPDAGERGAAADPWSAGEPAAANTSFWGGGQATAAEAVDAPPPAVDAPPAIGEEPKGAPPADAVAEPAAEPVDPTPPAAPASGTGDDDAKPWHKALRYLKKRR